MFEDQGRYFGFGNLNVINQFALRDQRKIRMFGETENWAKFDPKRLA